MAVKLRLVRMGKKKQPTYRVVAADSRRARSGALLEVVGTYQPRGLSGAESETVVTIDNEQAPCTGCATAPSRPSGSRACSRQSGAMDAFEAAQVSDRDDEYVAGDVNTIDDVDDVDDVDDSDDDETDDSVDVDNDVDDADDRGAPDAATATAVLEYLATLPGRRAGRGVGGGHRARRQA